MCDLILISGYDYSFVNGDVRQNSTHTRSNGARINGATQVSHFKIHNAIIMVFQTNTYIRNPNDIQGEFPNTQNPSVVSMRLVTFPEKI